MKPRDYCCCAIPTLNAGIYATLAEQFILGILVGTLAVATPSIVGASVPSFGPAILAVICYVGAGVQVFGFLGVLKEKAIMFRRYTTLHVFVSLGAFAVAAAWIIVSATKHNTATSKCETDFFTTNSTNSTSATSSEGSELCEIFTWVDVGVMGGLWVILAIMQFYLYIVISSYGTGQRRDHEKYNSMYSNQMQSDIPLATNRGDPWDARPSLEEDDAQRGYGHLRNGSSASVSTILGEKQQQPIDNGYGYSDGAYPPQPRDVSGPNRQASTDEAYLSHPSDAHTQEPGPTPQYFGDHYSGGATGVERPGRTQAHPAEGSFGRKMPRLQKPNPQHEFDGAFFSGQ